MNRLLTYMAMDVALALLVAIGAIVGPLLLWPQWSSSFEGRLSAAGTALFALLLLVSSMAYFTSVVRPDILLRRRWTSLISLAMPAFSLMLISSYLILGATLPAPDPTSKPLLVFGPTDLVQTFLWSTFTFLVFLPIGLTLLFWHLFTMYYLRKDNQAN